MRRYIVYLALYFGSVVVKSVVIAWKPAWAHTLNIVGTVALLIIAIQVARALVKDLTPPSPQEIARREAAAQQLALQDEAFARLEEERRIRRNARRRELRALRRQQEEAEYLQREERRKKVGASKKANPPTQETAAKSRWDRLIDGDE
jgi:hypothetical protein